MDSRRSFLHFSYSAASLFVGSANHTSFLKEYNQRVPQWTDSQKPGAEHA